MDAIILAGGLGTRLRSVVRDVPKCMAPIGDRPFLSILLDQISRFPKIKNVVLSVGYLKESIFEYIEKNGALYPFSIQYAIEVTPLGTGGGIKLALEKCVEDEVIIFNGDTFFDVDISEIQRFSVGKSITVALKSMLEFDRYGAVTLTENGRIKHFCEKKYCQNGVINGGVYFLHRSLIDFDNFPEKFSFEKDVLEPFAEGGQIYGIVQDGFFIDIGIPQDYVLAQLQWGGYKTLLLDRDGVINTLREGDYVKNWDEFEFRPEFIKHIKSWADAFKHIFIVTNQRGVGRGLMSADSLKDVHARMVEAIENVGGRIDGIYCCTSSDESDPRRKPNIGMWFEIIKDWPDVEQKTTVMLGDKESDIHFADNAGIKGLLIHW